MSISSPRKNTAAWIVAAVCAAGFAGSANAAVMTVGGITFNTDNSTQTLEMISGTGLLDGATTVTTGYATPHGQALWSGTSPDFPTTSLGSLVQRPDFQPGYSAGTPVLGQAGTAVTLGNDPDIAGTTNSRDIIRLTFGEQSPGVLNTLTNHNDIGGAHGAYDFAVYEQHTTEAFAVRVRNATNETGGPNGDGWSSWIYNVAETVFDSGADGAATLFELSDFGIIAELEVIDMIEITNLTADDRIATATATVLAPGLAEGIVEFNAESGLDPARWSGSSAAYVPFTSSKYNPDIQYVVGLHNLNNPPGGEPPTEGDIPEPGLVLLFAGAALMVLRRARI